MNKFYTLCLFLLSIFFLFSSNVSADTYTYNINSTAISLVKNNLEEMKSTVEAFININSSTYDNYYILDYFPINNSLKYSVFIFRKNTNLNNINLYYNTSWRSILLNQSSQCEWYYLSSDFSTITKYTNCENNIYGIYSNHQLLYSNFQLHYSNIDNIFIYNFEDTTFTEPTSDDLKFSTIYDMYQETFQIPPDNYPILTSFFSVFLDRLSFLADYITNSYIFLSIFVVFLFTFLFLLLRRLSQ